MIKCGIIGASGYAGAELLRILYAHPKADVTWIFSRTYEGKELGEVLGSFNGLSTLKFKNAPLEELSSEVDVIFTATPQGYLQKILTEEILEKAKVIDLSADYRIKDPKEYEKWYKMEHESTALLDEAVYGLCEKNRNQIRKGRLIANPGCYPTCSFLSIAPALEGGFIEKDSIIIDAKSGTSGAGRGEKKANLYCEVNESIKPYGIPGHRHTVEIEEQLSLVAKEKITVNFTPHLVPMDRGILVTAYASLKKNEDGKYPSQEEIYSYYEDKYKDEYFVRLLPTGTLPQTGWVKGSNFVDINVVVDERTGRLVMMGALDNIVKGAAGQAVQNMNLLFGTDEAEGLRFAPVFP